MDKVKDFIVKVRDALETRTGWGKEQVKDLLQRIYIDMLEEEVRKQDDTKDSAG